MGDLIFSDEAKALIKEQAIGLPKIEEKEFDKISPITVKEKYGVGNLNEGVGVMTVDHTFTARKTDPSGQKALNCSGVITPTSMVLPVYGNPFDTYVGNIQVMVDSVVMPPTTYFIEPLALGLHFKNLSLTTESKVELFAQYDYTSHTILKRVLILPISKDIPLDKIGEFAPVLFESISIEHLLRYEDNKKYKKKFDDCIEDSVYVIDYQIGKRGIYATIKYYI